MSSLILCAAIVFVVLFIYLQFRAWLGFFEHTELPMWGGFFYFWGKEYSGGKGKREYWFSLLFLIIGIALWGIWESYFSN